MRPWLDDFSSAPAMLAYATLLVEFVLSGRFGAVTRWIGVDGAPSASRSSGGR